MADQQDTNQQPALPPIVTNRHPAGSAKLTVIETAQLINDAANGLSLDELEDKYGICRDTVASYIKCNADRISRLKQDLANRCLGIAARAQSRITDDKLEKSSAAQLTTIAREQVYTAIMLSDGKVPGSGGNVQIDQIILQTANILQQTVDKSKQIKSANNEG